MQEKSDFSLHLKYNFKTKNAIGNTHRIIYILESRLFTQIRCVKFDAHIYQ